MDSSHSAHAQAASPRPGRRRFVALLVAAVVACNAAAIAVGVLNIVDSREKAEAMASQTVRNLVAVLDQSLSSNASKIDVALHALADELEREVASGGDYLKGSEIVALLRRYQSWLPETEGFRVYSADGNLWWSAHAGIPSTVNIADRDYFIALRDNPKAGLVVSRPIVGRVTNQWMIAFARRINRPDGRFAGIVLAAVPLRHFNELLSKPKLGAKGSAVLRYEDYGLIARQPAVEGTAGEIGNVWSSPKMRAGIDSGPEGYVHRVSDTSDKVERMNSGRRVAGLPFIVVVGMGADDYLAQWRSDATLSAVLLGVALLVSSSSVLAIGLFYRRQQEHASRAEASNVRLAAALDELSDRDRALAAAEQIGRLGVYSIDLLGRRASCSQPLRDVLGIPQDRPCGPDDMARLVHPDDAETIQQLTRELLLMGRDFDRSYRIVRPDGEVRWVHGLGQMLRDPAGRALSIHGAVQDITEYKRVEASLKNALDAYERLVARIPVGVFSYLWKPGGGARFTYASPRFCEQLGMDVERVMGEVTEVFRRVHADDRRDLEGVRLDPVGDTGDFIWEGRVEVGGEVRWLSVLTRPTYLDEGAVLWEGVQSDVTDRKLAEIARGDSEERYGLLLQYSPVGIMHLDAELKVVYCNEQFARIMNTTQAFLRNLDCTTLTDQSLLPAMRSALAGVPSTYEGAYTTTYAGEELLVSASCAPLRDAAGAIVGGIVILQDVTERARKDRELARYRDRLEELVAERTADLEAARAEAERLARVKSEFLANMSHEIRTPLNGVLGLARMGHRESLGRDAAQATFGRILSSGKLLLGIINDVLDFSKLEAGKLGIESIPVDIGTVIGDAMALMDEGAAEKGLALRLQRASSLPESCISDPLRLGQVLVNLLSNAIKFTERGGVTLHAGAEGGELVLRVIDTGIGMYPDELEKIFAPFEQADNSTTRRFGGTGLGLTITRRIVDLMGGRLSVDSVPGQGSSFEVRLPYVPVAAEPEASALEAGATTPGARLAGLRVLVAEDNEVNQIVLEDLLSSDGAEVTLVGNGAEALDCVRQRGADAFDLVLMDVQMPVMDGLMATRRLREMAPGLPVVGQTAHALDEERAACTAAGMVGHLAKPIDPDLLIEAVLRLRRRKPAASA